MIRGTTKEKSSKTCRAAVLRSTTRWLMLLSLMALIIAASVSSIIFLGSFRQLDVSGQVVDNDTGKPVAFARVVVIKGESQYIQHVPKGYAATADEQGRFHIRTGVLRGLGTIWVAACSPANEFARAQYNGNPVILRTSPPSPKYADRDYMSYEHFTGSSGVLLGGVEFVDEGWDVGK
jgi:hypothetical protein